MIRYCFTIPVLLILCSSVSYSQVNKTVRTSKTLEQQRAKQQQREQERYVKEQAILSLKTVLLNVESIENIQQKADVITEAADVLWDYDKPLAEESLLGFINQSFTDYRDLLNSTEKPTEKETSRLQDLSYAIKKSLNELAKKDIRKSKSLQNSFFEIRQQSLKGRELNDSFELAAEGFESDEQRTLDLLSAIIQRGIPSRFPKFVSELREKNPAAASLLTQRAIQNLTVNPTYTVPDAILISAIVFNESGILIPSLNDTANPNNFFVFSSFIGNQKKPVDRQQVSAYLAAAQNFFNLRLNNQGSGFFDSRQNLIRSYFLVEKLQSYNQLYKLKNPETLRSISMGLEALMQAAEFSQQTFLDVKGYAQRLVASDNPLALDDGTNLLEKAENSKEPKEKLDYLIRGIIRLIESKRFAEAQKEILDVDVAEIREALYTLFNKRVALESIKNKDWDEFEKRTREIAEKDAKAFLYLKALSTFESDKNNNLLPDYLTKAEINIRGISDKTVKASAYVYLTSLLLSLSQTEGLQMLPSTLAAVNEASDYYQNDFEITTKIPIRELNFIESLGANSFKTSFSKIAKIHDWDNSQAQVLQLKSEVLKSVAQIVTAQSVLKKKSSRQALISQ